METSGSGVAVVTGGSRGLGRAFVGECVRRGFAVVFGYRARAEDAAEVMREMASRGGVAVAVQIDLGATAAPGAFDALVDAAARLGDVSLLVNNAGVLEEASIAHVTQASWERTMAVNVTAPCFLTQALLAPLRRVGGSVLNVSSSGGVAGSLHGPAYGASKAALVGLTRTLARELAPNVRVNCIAPGPVATEMWDALTLEERTHVQDTTPLHRIAAPADIARAGLDLAGWPDCTGHVLVIDGGRVMS